MASSSAYGSPSHGRSAGGNVGLSQEAGFALAERRPGERDVGGEAELVHRLLQARQIGTVPGDDQPRVDAAPARERESLHGLERALGLHQAADMK